MTATHWLIDGGALTDVAWQALTQTAHCHRLYGFMKDESAERMGPILLPVGAPVSDLVHALKADPSRCWALSELISEDSTEALARHLSQWVHCWVADGQRFFFRFADGRSMRMVWAVLDDAQRLRVLGPVQCWRTTGRIGEALDLTVGPRAHATSHQPAWSHRLTLSETQFNQVLEQSWPDQLLSAVLAEAPLLADGIDAKRLHVLAAQTCCWLQEIGEERYPQQKAALAHVLQRGRGQWVVPPAIEASCEVRA